MIPAQAAMAKRMINACLCAYNVHPKGWRPDPRFGQPPVTRTILGGGGAYFYNVMPRYQDAVGFVQTAGQGYAPLFVSSGSGEINAALVGAMGDGNLVVAIRGTLDPDFRNKDVLSIIKDWLNDADVVPMDWQIRNTGFGQGSKGEAGFVKAMNSLWPGMRAMIAATLAQNTCTGVVVTGHSKGAALTFLAATLIEALFPQFVGKVHVHAFAAPVTGNAMFAAAYAPLAARTHRYQVENDVVPFLPLWKGANVFGATALKCSIIKRVLWDGLDGVAKLGTAGGYSPVGDFSYFNAAHKQVAGATPLLNALPAVATTLSQDRFSQVAAAHAAATSYLPCFP